MGLIKNGDTILVLDRKKEDWPGITLPGGKVRDDETIVEAMKREMLEESGLEMIDPKCIGYIEWLIDEDRHLCLLFQTERFTGDLKSSKEGEVFFMKIKDLKDQALSQDMDNILDLYGLSWR